MTCCDLFISFISLSGIFSFLFHFFFHASGRKMLARNEISRGCLQNNLRTNFEREIWLKIRTVLFTYLLIYLLLPLVTVVEVAVIAIIVQTVMIVVAVLRVIFEHI